MKICGIFLVFYREIPLISNHMDLLGESNHQVEKITRISLVLNNVIISVFTRWRKLLYETLQIYLFNIVYIGNK